MQTIKELPKKINWTIVMLIALVLEALYDIYLEWHFYYIYMHSDIATNIVFAKGIADQGHFLINTDWYPTTEIDFLHTQIIESILFRFTDSWKVVYVITFAIYLVAVAALIYYLTQMTTKNKVASLLAAMLTIMPGSISYQYNFQELAYAPYMILTFLFLILYVKVALPAEDFMHVRTGGDLCSDGSQGLKGNQQNTIGGTAAGAAITGSTADTMATGNTKTGATTGKKAWLYPALLFILSFLLGACGVRYLSLVLLPLYVYIVMKFLMNKDFKTLWTREFKYVIGITIAMLAGEGFAQLVWDRIYPSVYGQDVALVDYSNIILNIAALPAALMRVFGGATATNDATSIYGLEMLLLDVLLVFMYVIFILCHRKSDKGFFFWFLGSSVGANLLFLIFTTLGTEWNRPLEPHYLEIAMSLFFVVLMTGIYNNKHYSHSWKKLTAFILICVVLTSDAGAYEALRTSTPNRGYLEFLAQNGYTEGWSSNYWCSNVCVALSNGEIEIATYTSPDVFKEWGTPKSYKEIEPEFFLLKIDDAATWAGSEYVDADKLVYDDGQVQIYDLRGK